MFCFVLPKVEDKTGMERAINFYQFACVFVCVRVCVCLCCGLVGSLEATQQGVVLTLLEIEMFISSVF